MKQKILLLLAILALASASAVQADDGYRLWLKHDRITDRTYLRECSRQFGNVMITGESSVLRTAHDEFIAGLELMTGMEVTEVLAPEGRGTIIAGTFGSSPLVASLLSDVQPGTTGEEGYIIRSFRQGRRNITVVASEGERGVLYGIFHLLRIIESESPLDNLTITEKPATKLRLLNHWDNLDGTVERGYAGASIWNWHLLPDYIHPRYRDYARANASIGINGTVITNVNANALVLTYQYLLKVAALAEVMRPYGIKVYLTARFSSPREIGGLTTADPLDPEVINWWKEKVAEIYTLIPDFGGFLVKANSEGQPGPQNYGRSHADGANMLAGAVAPFGGVVMWRAFVYDNNVPVDRAKQAYNEFVPLDGTFRDNVLIQVKNGPVDFQPREPFHPLFGAMPETPLMPEFQVTQEYLGCATHLVFLAPLFSETLASDTYAAGPGSKVSGVIDGTLHGYTLTGMAGVSNIGSERNWTGHLFGQANWYAFGRLAWNPALSPEQIASEWIRMTITHDPAIEEGIAGMMLSSRETAVNYMTPLGLHHIMAEGHHWGPGPWVERGRPDWTSVYYHRADTVGIGFDRTKNGSGAVSQYFPPLDSIFNDPRSCPENLLLWFHHLPWYHVMKSGRTLWDEMCIKYQEGVDSAEDYLTYWESLEGKIDGEQFGHIRQMLSIQAKEARWWKDACLTYFQTFSRMPFPDGVEQPLHNLEYYRGLRFHYVPGI
ncbi:MAG TPA: alpha-glucuronidase [Bacteroidales bacterium]|nr:alpha-glucuronidase [Bacteroidales bacterium]